MQLINAVKSLFDIFTARLDADSLQLWRRYQLAAAPAFFGVVALLVIMVVIRNYRTGTGSLAASAVVMTLMAALAISSWFNTRLFLRLGTLPIYIIPSLIMQYFSWPNDEPAPTLLIFPMAILFQAAADSLRIASLYLLTTLVLLVHNSMHMTAGGESHVTYLLAIGVSACMLYAAAVVLWVRLVNLFNAKSQLMDSIRQSSELRRSLLKVFIVEISAPVDRLVRLLDSAQVDWPAIAQLGDKLEETIAKTRTTTLEVGRKLQFMQSNFGREIEQIRHNSWMGLVYSAVGCTVGMALVYLIGPWPIRFSLLASVVVSLVLARAARKGVRSALLRRLSVYVLAALIAWACFLRLEVGETPYSIYYFMVVVFSAVIVSGIVDALVVAAVAALFILLWYLQTPTLPVVAAAFRNNMLVALGFTTSFSVIMWYWLERVMREIGDKETSLKQETDLRQRLMATLFHDVANPLQVIIAEAELAVMNPAAESGVTVIRDLAGKIRQLVDVTRELEALDAQQKDLPLDAVSLREVFDDLQQIFAPQLTAKNLRLQIAPTAQNVMAHRSILCMSVFANLLTNAIKFSPRGGTITITTDEQGFGTSGLLSVSISDEGKGIPADTVVRMQQNAQVESLPGTEGEEGDGQGLRLVSLYLAKMGGKLELDTSSTVQVKLRIGGPPS